MAISAKIPTRLALAKLVREGKGALHFNDHIDETGDIVFRHACKLGFEDIMSKRLASPYVSGRSRHWIKSKNPAAPAVKREAEKIGANHGGSAEGLRPRGFYGPEHA